MTHKIGWKCIIPGCTSPAKAPGHYFPKNKEVLKKWLETISVPWVSNLPEGEIRKCRICHLHFSDTSYIFTINRRRLKHDAIPNLSIETIESDISQPTMSQVQESNITAETISQPTTSQVEESNITSETISQPITSQIQENNTTLETNINIDILERETQQETQQLNPDIVTTPKSTHCTKHVHRNILGSVTRQDHLTPKAKKLYFISRACKKQNNALRRTLIHYKQRMKTATKFASLSFFKQYLALSNTQKMFIDMQIKNRRKKSKVNFSMFCTKIKSALKSICNDEHVSIFLENIGIDSS